MASGAQYDVTYDNTQSPRSVTASDYILRASAEIPYVEDGRADVIQYQNTSMGRQTTETLNTSGESIAGYVSYLGARPSIEYDYWYSFGQVLRNYVCPDSSIWKALDVPGYDFVGWYTLAASSTSGYSDPGSSSSAYSLLITADKQTTWGTIRAGMNYYRHTYQTDTSGRTVRAAYYNYVRAKYRAKTVTVIYNANRGSGAPAQATATYGVNFKISSTTPTRSRYVFLGWSTDKDATTPTYYAGQTYKFPASMFEKSSVVLYAVWQYGAVIAAFNAMGGTVSPRYLVLMKGGKYGTLPTAHYGSESSSSWYTAATGGTLVTANSTVPNSDHVLYSHWNTPATSHTLTFDANGGTVSPTSRSLAEGAEYGSLPTPTRSGYTFVEWRTAPFLGDRVTSSTQMGTDDVTIYAIWTGNPFTITFNANGGTVSPSTKSVPNGNPFGTLPTPTRSGWVFDGWYTAATGGTKISVTAKPSSSQTVYAHWHQQLPEGGSEQWVY